ARVAGLLGPVARIGRLYGQGGGARRLGGRAVSGASAALEAATRAPGVRSAAAYAAARGLVRGTRQHGGQEDPGGRARASALHPPHRAGAGTRCPRGRARLGVPGTRVVLGTGAAGSGALRATG